MEQVVCNRLWRHRIGQVYLLGIVVLLIYGEKIYSPQQIPSSPFLAEFLSSGLPTFGQQSQYFMSFTLFFVCDFNEQSVQFVSTKGGRMDRRKGHPQKCVPKEREMGHF